MSREAQTSILANACVAIIDYGVGNVRSVQLMLKKIGVNSVITNRPEELVMADGLILPGVGAFGAAMGKLSEHGLKIVLRHLVLNELKPILGICLGMQLLLESSEESPGSVGLRLIPGSSRKISIDDHLDWLHRKLVLPHMGWSPVVPVNNALLFEGIPTATDFYFAHSYHVQCDDAFVSAYVHYGPRLTCALRHKHVFGVQFHPEKSQRMGYTVMTNYLSHVTAHKQRGNQTTC